MFSFIAFKTDLVICTPVRQFRIKTHPYQSKKGIFLLKVIWGSFKILPKTFKNVLRFTWWPVENYKLRYISKSYVMSNLQTLI